MLLLIHCEFVTRSVNENKASLSLSLSLSPVTTIPCVDKNKRKCPIWALQGKCDTVPDYNKICRLSCRICFPGEPYEFVVVCSALVYRSCLAPAFDHLFIYIYVYIFTSSNGVLSLLTNREYIPAMDVDSKCRPPNGRSNHKWMLLLISLSFLYSKVCQSPVFVELESVTRENLQPSFRTLLYVWAEGKRRTINRLCPIEKRHSMRR